MLTLKEFGGHSNGFTMPGIQGDTVNDSNQSGCVWSEVTGTQHTVSVEPTLDCNGGKQFKITNKTTKPNVMTHANTEVLLETQIYTVYTVFLKLNLLLKISR